MLASDGIWDVMTNDDVVRLCLRKIEIGIPPEQICEELMTECLSPDLLTTGTDNMTVVLICFLHNKPYEDLCKRAKDINERERRKAEELHKAYNESYPATSIDASESISVSSINVQVTNFDDDNDDDDAFFLGDSEDDDETNEKNPSDNVKKSDDGNQNVSNTSEQSAQQTSLKTASDVPQAETDANNGQSATKSPRNPSDTNDENDDIQESKKHKDNESLDVDVK